jgi:drug/metabolite transporter (DMT)-like permease
MKPPELPPSPPVPGKLAGRLWVLVAALMWSTSGLFAKAPLFDDFDLDRGLVLAFWRAAFAAMVLVPMIRRPKWNVRLVPMTICFTVMSVTFLTAMARTTAANAIWLQATSPWWTFLLAVLIFRERVARRDLIPLGFGVLGVGTILWFELVIHPQDVTGVLCGLVSGICFACVVLFMRRLRDQGSVWLIALNHLVATAVMLPWVIHAGIWPRPDQLAVLAGFGIFQMAIPYVLVSRALRTISSQEVIGICLIEPVLTPVWVLFWGEVPATWTVVGASLILLGLVLRYVVLESIVAARR